MIEKRRSIPIKKKKDFVSVKYFLCVELTANLFLFLFDSVLVIHLYKIKKQNVIKRRLAHIPIFPLIFFVCVLFFV